METRSKKAAKEGKQCTASSSTVPMKTRSKKAAKEGKQCTASSSSSSSVVFIDIPSHIIMEILSRLPLRTIVSCKFVCKTWLHLINDPQFSKQHQSRAKIEVCFQRYWYSQVSTVHLYMANCCFRNDSRCFEMKLNTLLGFPKFSVKSNNLLNYDLIRGTFSFVNSCNGLLCYSGEPTKFAVIWNPITGEFVTFPGPKINLGLSNCRAYGLGFSRKDNRFKLLRIMARKEYEWSEEVVVAEICTIEKGCSWRTVGPCPYSIWRPFGPHSYGRPMECFMEMIPVGSFLQSALHWIGADSRKTDMVVVSFDFEDEKFGEVPLPPHFKTMDSNYPDSILGVLGDCLFITDHTDRSVSIWLMKEYGVHDSWTEVFSFQFTCKRCIPISYLDNGEVLMMRSGMSNADMFLYNQDSKSVRVIGSGPWSLIAVAFSPSLALLKDSMMGYDVHAKPRCAELKHREKESPSWWQPMAY